MGFEKVVSQGTTADAAAAKIKPNLEPAAADNQGGKDQKAKKTPPKKADAKTGTDPDATAQPSKKAKPKADQEQAQVEGDEGVDDENDEAQGDDQGDADPNDQSEEDQGAEGEDGDTDDEPGDDEGEDGELHTVKIDGKEVQVSLSELKAGYMRGADYSRKSQKLAQERKEVETAKEAVKDLPQVQKRYEDGSKIMSQRAELVFTALEKKFMPPVPTAELLESDPKAYVKAKELREEAEQFMAQLQGEGRRIHAENENNLRKAVAEGRKKLYELHPDFSPDNKEKGTANRQKLREYAIKHGFTDEMIAREPNPVLFDWAIKAMKYDEIMANRATLRSDQPRSKVVKQGKAPADQKASKDRQRTDALATHGKQGTVSSAAAALSASRSR